MKTASLPVLMRPQAAVAGGARTSSIRDRGAADGAPAGPPHAPGSSAGQQQSSGAAKAVPSFAQRVAAAMDELQQRYDTGALAMLYLSRKVDALMKAMASGAAIKLKRCVLLPGSCRPLCSRRACLPCLLPLDLSPSPSSPMAAAESHRGCPLLLSLVAATFSRPRGGT